MPLRPRGFPFVRIGLLLIVGALAVSLFEFYTAYGELASDFDAREAMPESRKELFQFFRERFLLLSSRSAILLWSGVALGIFGALQQMFRASSGR
jgi:hypothetical protein